MIVHIRRLIIFIMILSSPLWLSWLVWILSPTLPLKVRLVDYSMIAPVIDQRCAYIGCHGAGDVSPDLSSFNRISNGTFNGKDVTEAIYEAVIVTTNKHYTGNLSDEELSLFEDWKNNGFAE